jgi:hypothetical protein
VSIVRNTNANCLSAPLPTQTNYCIDVTYFPAAKGFFNQLQVAMCTQDEDSPFADVSNPLVTLGHKKSTTGKVEALTRWPSPTTAATLVCGHGSPPSVAAGRFRGVMESFLASVKNTFLPRPLYAVNGGLGISDDFSDGTSPFASVNTLVFYDDFSTDIIGTAPALQSTDVGTSWASSVQSPGSITVQTGLGFVQDTVVVLSQALGNCETCPTLSLIGTLAYGSPGVLHDVGTYVAAVRMTQNKPAPKDAPMVLQSSTGGEIARLTYVAESGTKYLRYSGNGGVPANIFYTSGPFTGQLVSWQIGVGQDFEITVNLDANTMTSGVNKFLTKTRISDNLASLIINCFSQDRTVFP